VITAPIKEPAGQKLRGNVLVIASQEGGHGIRRRPVEVLAGTVVAPGSARVAVALAGTAAHNKQNRQPVGDAPGPLFGPDQQVLGSRGLRVKPEAHPEADPETDWPSDWPPLRMAPFAPARTLARRSRPARLGAWRRRPPSGRARRRRGRRRWRSTEPRNAAGDAVMGKSQGVARPAYRAPARGTRTASLPAHATRPAACAATARATGAACLGDPGAGDVEHRLVVLELGAGRRRGDRGCRSSEALRHRPC
jgi:hypothetical protein